MKSSSSVAGAEPIESEILAALRSVPDFPRPGIVFRDITPLLATPALFRRCADEMAARYADAAVTHVAAVESRGFIFGAPVAERLGAAFVPVRKPGKLPYRTERLDYALEYGTDALEVHADACARPAVVLVVDDVLATGGTARATCRLMERLGARVAGSVFLLELVALGGRAALGDVRVEALAAV